MAIHAHSTTVPTGHPRLLRSAGFACDVLTDAEVVALTAEVPTRLRDARVRFMRLAPVGAPKLGETPELHCAQVNSPAASRSVPIDPDHVGAVDESTELADVRRELEALISVVEIQAAERQAVEVAA